MGRRCRGEFYSILDLKENLEKEKARPAFYVDLNLDQVIHRISRDWGEDVSPLYYYLPADSADSGQLVEKHGLSYAGLKERLGRRCRPQDLGGEAQGGKGA